MKKVWADKYSFVGGVIKRKSLMFFVVSDDEIAEEKIPFSMYLAWKDGAWLDAGNMDWLCAGISVTDDPVDRLMAVGEQGEVFIRGGGEDFETVATGGGPAKKGPLRCLRKVADCHYAVGTGRQVYRRTSADAWKPFDQGLASKGKKVTGFESVDGFDSKELYAVGLEGEIWQCDGEKWTQRQSPTDLILLDVCCAGDGNVYVGGQRGVLVLGRNDEWTLVADQDVEQDFWSLAWFKNELYVASMNDLFKLVNGKLVPVDFGTHHPQTFYKLSVADGRLLSVGAKDVMLFDGRRWTRIE